MQEFPLVSPGRIWYDFCAFFTSKLPDMTIIWHGLSCFEIHAKTSGGGEAVLVTDPYENSSGLRFPRTLSADLVAASHEGEDGDAGEAVQGKPFRIRLPGEYEVKGIFVFGIHAPLLKGSRSHRLFRMELEDLRLAHLGALDRPLSDGELQELSNIDILFLPVGGGRVLDAKKAVEVVGQVEPRIVIPMTYALPGLKEEFQPVDAFLKEFGSLQKEQAARYKVSKRDLPEEDMKIVTLERA